MGSFVSLLSSGPEDSKSSVISIGNNTITLPRHSEGFKAFDFQDIQKHDSIISLCQRTARRNTIVGTFDQTNPSTKSLLFVYIGRIQTKDNTVV